MGVGNRDTSTYPCFFSRSLVSPLDPFRLLLKILETKIVRCNVNVR